MLLKEFVRAMETIAPPSLALDLDNVGLLVGTERREIRNVLVALDCTMAVAQEAVERDVDLVLTHHPRFFTGVQRILPDEPETAPAYRLIQHNIAHFAAHTNLDAALGGVNDCLCEILGVLSAEPLAPENLGRIGTLAEPISLGAFCARIEKQLHTLALTNGDPKAAVFRVACIGGAGGGDVAAAVAAGADTFVTGEIKHHQALEAAYLGCNVIAAGHYETERVVLAPLIARLQQETIDVQYHLALSDVSPLARLGGTL